MPRRSTIEGLTIFLSAFHCPRAGLAANHTGLRCRFSKIPFVLEEGCLNAQGYWFSWPMPAGDLQRLFNDDARSEGLWRLLSESGSVDTGVQHAPQA